MDADRESQLLALDRVSWDQTMEPTNLPLPLLRYITNDFSKDHEIGRGGYGAVYKGDLRNGTVVAVKKLFHSAVILDENFRSEVEFLMGGRHKNTVRLLGFCLDTQGILAPSDEGKPVWAEVQQRLLCFELLRNGSLAGYITDASSGLHWSTRYDIIRGIVEGVHHLHQQRIIHRDLKPQNILLDDHMMPKISDFGLSRRFTENQSRDITKNIVGLWGYMPPEYLTSYVITYKTDIFSLGVVIMEILMGCRERPNVREVLESWRNRFGTPESHILLEQVEVCAKIAIQCMDDDPEKRPTSSEIILRIFDEEEISNWSARGAQSTSSITQACSFADKLLNKFKSMNLYSKSFLPKLVSALKRAGDPSTEIISYGLTATDLLDVHPLELRFPFEANKQNIAGILSPRTTCGVILRMVEQQEQPLNRTTLYIAMIITSESTEKLFDLFSSNKYKDNDDDLNPLKRIEALGGHMHLAMATALVFPQREIITPKTIFTKELVLYHKMDLHPTDPWVAITGWSDDSIWNYQTNEEVMSFGYYDHPGWLGKMPFSATMKAVVITSYQVINCSRWPIRMYGYAVKFIPRKHWFVTGGHMGDSGKICVYSYATRKVVKKFSAHSGSLIYSLAVHPTYPLLISLSENIKVWDWDTGWQCVQTINVGDVCACRTRLTFNPKDATTFAGGCGTCHVWSIHSSEPHVTIREAPKMYGNPTNFAKDMCGYLYSDSPQQYLITAAEAGGLAVYDLKTVSCVHGLVLQNECIDAAVCHPTLPVMVTGSSDGDEHQMICFWNTANYRVLKMVRRLKKLRI